MSRETINEADRRFLAGWDLAVEYVLRALDGE